MKSRSLDVGFPKQAYLEAEPATRTTKDEYVMRYQRFAKHGLDKAIQKYEGLHSNIGVITHIPPAYTMTCRMTCMLGNMRYLCTIL